MPAAVTGTFTPEDTTATEFETAEGSPPAATAESPELEIERGGAPITCLIGLFRPSFTVATRLWMLLADDVTEPGLEDKTWSWSEFKLILDADEDVGLLVVTDAVVPLARREAELAEDESPDSSSCCLLDPSSIEFERSKDTSWLWDCIFCLNKYNSNF